MVEVVPFNGLRYNEEKSAKDASSALEAPCWVEILGEEPI